MRALEIAVGTLWVVFWLYWLVSARGAKRGSGRRRRRPPGLFIALIALLLTRIFDAGQLVIHDPALEAVGFALFLCGLGLAVRARVYLGRNWGMPMTEKEEPELVTSGPYRFVRHPIYSGILLAMLGSGLAASVFWIIALAVVGPYFLYSARIEEGLMSRSFPDAYASYRARTKMLIPFVL